MTLYWNTITDREIDILGNEEHDIAVLRHLFAPGLGNRPLDEDAAIHWIVSRAQLAKRWNTRQDAAFERAKALLAELVAERDRCDNATWPAEPFLDIRWRSIDPRGGGDGRLVEVAWHDAREQLRLTMVRVHAGTHRVVVEPVGGDDLGRDQDRISALLSYDLALEPSGQTRMQDPDA